MTSLAHLPTSTLLPRPKFDLPFSSSIQQHLLHLLPITKQLLQHQFVRFHLQDEDCFHCRCGRVRRWCCRTVPGWVPFLWCKLTSTFALNVPVSRAGVLDIAARGVEVQWPCSGSGYLVVPSPLSIRCPSSQRTSMALLFPSAYPPRIEELPSSSLRVNGTNLQKSVLCLS